MKNLKKLMSVILTVAMLLSLVATSVGAATFADVEEDNVAFEAIEVLAALEILEGKEEGNFDPEANIKRSEFAAVVCRAMNQEAAAAGSASVAKFTDVASNHWAAGYINWAAGLGIVNGMGDGTFAPDANVTYEQAVAMIVRALGFEPLAIKRGGFPTGYMVLAANYKITDDVAMSPASAPASRAGVAQLVYNAFDAPLMEESMTMNLYGGTGYNVWDGSSAADGVKKTLLSEYHGIWMAQASVVNTYRSNPDNLYNKKTGEKEIELDIEGVYKYSAEDFMDGYYEYDLFDEDGKFEGEENIVALADNAAFADYLGYNVNVFLTFNEDEEVVVLAMVADTKNFDIITINNIKAYVVEASVESGVPYFEYWESLEDSRTETIDFITPASDITYYVNGIEGNASNFEAIDADADVAEVTLIGTSAGISKVFITTYTYALVESVDTELGYVETDNGTFQYSEDNDDILTYNFYKDGAAITLADIAVGDLLNIAVGASDKGEIHDVYVTNNVVEGSIAYTSEDEEGNTVYTIGETDYYTVNSESWAPGAAGEFYVTIDGRIWEAEISRDFVGNYAFILDAGKTDNGTFGDYYQVKLLNKDNEVKVYTIANSLKVEEGNETKTYKNDASATNKQDTLFGDLAALIATNKRNVVADEEVAFEMKVDGLFITFKANGDTITSISFPTADADDAFNKAALGGELAYNKDKNKLEGKYTTDSTVVFSLAPTYVEGEETDDEETDVDETENYWYFDENRVQVYSVNRLKDDKAYEGFAYAVNDNKEIGALAITSDMGSVANENSLALVKGVSSGLNAAGETADMLNVFIGGEFASYAVNDTTLFVTGGYDDLEDLSIGDVVQISVNAAGELDAVAVIFDFTNKVEGEVVNSGVLVTETYDEGIFDAGLVIDDNKGVTLSNGADYAWGLVDGGTNVLFDLTKPVNNAISGKSSTAHIRDNVNKDGDAFISDAYMIVVKVNDDSEIEDVVAYKYNTQYKDEEERTQYKTVDELEADIFGA